MKTRKNIGNPSFERGIVEKQEKKKNKKKRKTIIL
jgi:hypothetical protein